jgi:hypothetical protein
MAAAALEQACRGTTRTSASRRTLLRTGSSGRYWSARTEDVRTDLAPQLILAKLMA